MAQKTDVWMPIYIGDYLADTSHLTTEEHGAYLLLMFHYWRTGPLPSDERRLMSIAGISGDAWSIAWALLKGFFVPGEDGALHHKRIDHELKEASEKRQKSTERAEKAARARWGDAPSIAQASPQALLEQCPSPSPSPKKRQKPSGKPGGESRHGLFHEQINRYWKHKNGEELALWDGSEGKALSALLAAKPDLTIEDFRRCLKHRGDSPGEVQTERPRQWLPNILRFAGGPLDRYGKPLQAPITHRIQTMTREEAMAR